MATSGERPSTAAGVATISTALGNPAAGADWSSAQGSTHQVISVFATLATSAAVANRLPALQILDAAAHIVVALPASSVQAAALTETYVWGVNLPFTSGNNQNLIPIPAGIVVANGWTIRTVTSALQAADQWSAIVVATAG